MTQQPTQTEHDPVCHMDIEIADAAGRSDYEGHTYYFCSMGCKRNFDTDPEGVLKAEGEYDHSQPVDHSMMAGMTGSATSGSAAPARPWWKFWG